MKRLSMAMAAFFTVASAHAQTTWIVDASGAGGSFTTIQAALDAAADGDTILVRAGLYSESPQTSKGVMIAVDPGVQIFNFFGAGFTIANLGAGKTFTLRGLQISPPAAGIQVRNCTGGVHLEEITSPFLAQFTSIIVENSAQVTLTDVTATGVPAIWIKQSRAVLMGCSANGTVLNLPQPALSIDNSTVTVVGGSIVGGPSWLTRASPAIEMIGGSLTLAGRNTVVAAGQDALGAAVPALNAVGGAIDLEPAVTLQSQNGAPAITGSATLITRRIPSVLGDGLASLGSWTLDLHAPTGRAFCLFVSLPRPPAVTPWGELWFSPAAHVGLACGTVGPGDQFAMAVPLLVLPPAIPIVVQGSVAMASGLVLTTPSVNVTR